MPGFSWKSQFYGSLILVFGARQSHSPSLVSQDFFLDYINIEETSRLCAKPVQPCCSPWHLFEAVGRESSAHKAAVTRVGVHSISQILQRNVGVLSIGGAA